MPPLVKRMGLRIYLKTPSVFCLLCRKGRAGTANRRGKWGWHANEGFNMLL